MVYTIVRLAERDKSGYDIKNYIGGEWIYFYLAPTVANR
jgi:hypothetical protein